jgi:D-alanyl-D-alanine carboxypeptidase
MRLNPRSLILAAALIAPAAAFTAACGDSDTAAPPAAAAARPTLAAVTAAGAPGVIELINDGDKIRVDTAHAPSERALRPTDRFRAGSITKSFVATVALQLAGESKLSLSDTVERWLPGILPYGDHVTVRQLLNLTSGVPDNQEWVDAEFIKGNMTRSWSPRELVALVADKRPDFKPGTSWAYSNTSYVLAGLIIERATGHSLAHEVEQRIIEPLHLRRTSFPVNETTIAGPHANGYALVDGKLLDVTTVNPSGMWAAGNLVTDAADLARFWRALLGGKLLTSAQLSAMKTTVPSFEGTALRYGLGTQEIPSDCGPLWGNGGSIVGYTNMSLNSEDGTHQAALMVNANPVAEAVGEARDVAIKLAMGTALGRRTSC